MTVKASAYDKTGIAGSGLGSRRCRCPSEAIDVFHFYSSKQSRFPEISPPLNLTLMQEVFASGKLSSCSAVR